LYKAHRVKRRDWKESKGRSHYSDPIIPKRRLERPVGNLKEDKGGRSVGYAKLFLHPIRENLKEKGWQTLPSTEGCATGQR